MATIAGDAPYEERSLFVRKATGLVRGWSVHDAFIYATFSINLITLGLYIFASGPFIPKGSLLLAIILSGAYLCFQTIVYAALRRRLRLGEPRDRRRHRLCPRGLRLVVHQLALGADLREHPEQGVLPAARRSARLERLRELLGRAEGRVLGLGHHCRARRDLHLARHARVREVAEDLLLLRHGGPPD